MTELQDFLKNPDMTMVQANVDIEKLAKEFVELREEFDELQERFNDHTHRLTDAYIEGSTGEPE